MQIDCEPSPSPETLAAARAGMRHHAEAFVPWEDYADIDMVARAGDGAIAGAASGEAGRGWLHVSVVWVDERFRRRRLGMRLLQAIEQEAVRRGCRGAYLDTFSCQARPFYESLGYEVFGTLDDYPLGHQRFLLCANGLSRTRPRSRTRSAHRACSPVAANLCQQARPDMA